MAASSLPLRAAGSLKKVNSQLLWSTLLWVTCSFSKGEEMETVATATRMRSGAFIDIPSMYFDRVIVCWQLYKLLSQIRREAGSIGQNTPWLWHQISHNWCWHKKDIVRIALLCIFPAIFEDFSHEMSALEDIAFLWVVYLVTQIGEHLHLLYDIAEKG